MNRRRFLTGSASIVGSFSAFGGLAGLTKTALFDKHRPANVGVKNIAEGAKAGAFVGGVVVAAATAELINPQDSDLSTPATPEV